MNWQIDKFARTPIYEQLVNDFTRQLLAGLIAEGDRLPSVRELSVSLGINPNTIQKAYLELDRLELISSVPGRGSFVTKGARERVLSRQIGQLKTFAALARELMAYGIPKEDLFAVLNEATGKDETHD